MKKLAPITIEDFGRIAQRLGPCELVKGEIVRLSPGYVPHSQVSANITRILGNYAHSSRTGRVLGNEAGVVVDADEGTVRGADALFISYKRMSSGRKYAGFLTRPPELIVEVMGEDESWHAIEEKVAEYHGIGVDLVWVADPRTQAVRAYPRDKEPFVLQKRDKIFGGKLLPGFSCRVGEFFED
jgi:Uma2 family endonuclease